MRNETQYSLKKILKSDLTFLVLEHYSREGGWKFVQALDLPKPWYNPFAKKACVIILTRTVQFGEGYANPEDV